MHLEFRHWCQEKWYEHRDELAEYGQAVLYTSEGYFQKYKYWLKREYRYQQSNIL